MESPMAASASLPFAHWYHLIEGLQESSQQFYSNLEASIQKKQINKIKISRTVYKEGGIFSAKREYLRVQWRQFIFDICAAPFGNSFFVSWWLGEKPSEIQELFLLIPFLGPLIVRAFRPTTYFRLDSSLMFQESIHLSILEILDQVIEVSGLRILSEVDRKPILRDLFKK